MKRFRLRKSTILVIGIFVALLGAILLSPKVSDSLKELIVNRTVKYDGIEGYEDSFASTTINDDVLGTWIFKTTFSGDNFILENNDSQLVYTAIDNTLSENRIDVDYTVSYQANTSLYDIEPGEIFISLPNLIFGTNDSLDYVGTYDEENNELLFTKNDTLVLKISLGDIGLFDFDNIGGSGGIFGLDKYSILDGFIYVVNDKTIPKDQTLDFNIRFTYYFVPNVFENGEINTLEPYYSIYNTETDYMLESTLKLVTQLNYTTDETKLKKDEAVLFEEWQDEWGSNGYNDDYYFVEYKVSANLYAGTPYDIFLSLNNRDGDIAAYGDGTNYNLGSDWNTSSTIFHPNDSFANISGTLDSNDSLVRTVVVAYTKPDPQQEKNTSFEMNYSVNGEMDSFLWNVSYFNDGTTELEYPNGVSDEIVEKVTDERSSVGAINKLESNQNISGTMTIESSSSNINTDNNGNLVKAFNIWNLTNNGTDSVKISLDSNGLYLDESYSSDTDLRSLSSSDYQIVSMYPLDDIEYDYVEGTGKYVLKRNDQVSVYDSKKIYAEVDGEYVYVGSYKKDNSGIVYTDETGSRTVNEGNPVLLPEGTTNVRVEYEGVKTAVYIGFAINYDILSTDSVKTILQDFSDSDVVLKGKAKVLFNDEEKKDTGAGTYLTKLTSNSFITSSGEKQEKEGTSDVIKYQVSAYEQIAYSDDVEFAKSILNKQEQATYYVLLPQGVTIDDNVLVSNYRGDNITNFTYRVTNNYYDNRNLFIVNINNTDDNYYISDNYVQYGYTLSYTAYYDAIANQSYGINLKTDVVYTSDDLSDGEESINDVSSDSFTSTGSKDSLKTLDMYNKLMVSKNTVTVDPITITVGRFDKTVDVSKVVESKLYTYTLQYSASSNYDKIKNLVFVDKLESADTDSNYFKGILYSVDTSYLNNNGISTTVYYTTSDIDVDHVDITDSIWSTSLPGNRENIKAIAVSTGTREIDVGSGITPKINIKMTASNSSIPNKTLLAKNQAVIHYLDFYGANAVLRSDITSVELEKADISVDMNYRSSLNDVSLGKGTSSNPIIISGDYGYYLTVKNNDSNNSFSGIKLTDTLPDDIELNGDAVVVDSDQASRVTITGDKTLTISISSINASESIDIWIPVHLVNEENTSVFDNSVSMTKLGNKNYNGSKIDVYTKASVPVLDFYKYVKTASHPEYGKDEVFVLTTGENYSYKITLENVSNINASAVKVVDIVPDGLNIDTLSITDGGVYDSSNRTVTWNLNLDAGASKEFTYSVTLASNATLGTYYSSNAHVTYANPINPSVNLYDDDTNNISTYYQIVSDIIVQNQVSGELANLDKEFAYKISFDGSSTYMGSYEVLDKERNKVGVVSIDSEGKGEYSFVLKNDEEIVIKLLPGNMNYTITQESYPGYQTSNNKTLNSVITGKTSEEVSVSYTYQNQYHANTSVQFNAMVSYERELSAGMFEVLLIDGDHEKVKEINETGEVTFDSITYLDVEGTYTYQIKQSILENSQIIYDSQVFIVRVLVSDNGDGTLKADVKYYNSSNEEVDCVIFTNEYVPFGLTIVNNNTSKYINPDKVFSYQINIANALEGEYQVLKNGEAELDNLVIDSTGSGSYRVELKSNEKVTIVDLNTNSTYVISQQKEDYYETSAEDGVENENSITVSGTIGESSAQVIFENVYHTTTSYQPELRVILTEKEIENQEFTFVLKDMSTGSTNGYTEIIKNDENGSLDFSSITFDRPGTYIYHISQVLGVSNHIYYDGTKCILTLVLTDNGDGTMNAEYDYHYDNGNREFVNRYSVEPIVLDPEPIEVEDDNPKNPNTIDYIIIIILGLVLIINILIIQRKTRVQKFN